MSVFIWDVPNNHRTSLLCCIKNLRLIDEILVYFWIINCLSLSFMPRELILFFFRWTLSNYLYFPFCHFKSLMNIIGLLSWHRWNDLVDLSNTCCLILRILKEVQSFCKIHWILNSIKDRRVSKPGRSKHTWICQKLRSKRKLLWLDDRKHRGILIRLRILFLNRNRSFILKHNCFESF